MSAGLSPQSAEFLRHASVAEIFQAAGVVVSVGLVVIDDAQTVTLINPQAARLLGVDPARVLGHQIADLPDTERDLFTLMTRLDGEKARGTVTLPASSGGGGQVLEVSIQTQGLGSDAVRVFSLRRFGPADPVEAPSSGWAEAEDRLGMIATGLPGLVFHRVMRSTGQIDYPFFSGGVQDALGYAPADMRVTPDGCLGCLHWADRDDYMDRIRRSAVDLTPYSETVRAVTRDGRVRWLSGTARPERMENGDIRWDCVLIDVSDRMLAEQRLSMIMDHAADGILTFDDLGTIELINAAAARVFDLSPGALQGQSVFSLMPDHQAEEHRQALARHNELGGGWIIGAGPHEMDVCRSDGRLIPVELTVSEVVSDGHRTFIAVVRDITRRRETEARLHASEHRLLSITGNLQGMVFQILSVPEETAACGAVFTYASDGCRDLLGVLPTDLTADPQVFTGLMDLAQCQTLRQALAQSADRMDPLELDLYLRARSGIGHWVRFLGTPRAVEAGRLIWDGVALDVTDRKRVEDELTFLAYYDPLTRLGNRALFLDRFPGTRADADRSRSMVGVLMLGVDRFTMINTTCGHDVGDQVLRQVAGRLQALAGQEMLACRTGGDQFLLLVPGLRDRDALLAVIARISEAFISPVSVGPSEFDLSVSAGVSMYPQDGLDADTLIRHAEAALHRAKGQGPGGVEIYTEALGRRASQMLTMRQKIRRGLDAGQFIAHFQPKVQTATGQIVGLEALARWQTVDRGMVPPSEFIEIAEDYGLIDAICQQVMQDSCRWIRHWQDRGLPTVPVAVNISGRQFQNSRQLMAGIRTALETWRLLPAALELELTETSAMADPAQAISVVTQLKDMGIICAIDDFGTGYSSLSVLRRFPIQHLKIDRSFIHGVSDSGEDAAIVRAVIAMARALGLSVVAEGIETRAQWDFLRGEGCDQGQGYLFSRPVCGDAVASLLGQVLPL